MHVKGKGMTGKKHSEESKKKMSMAKVVKVDRGPVGQVDRVFVQGPGGNPPEELYRPSMWTKGHSLYSSLSVGDVVLLRNQENNPYIVLSDVVRKG